MSPGFYLFWALVLFGTPLLWRAAGRLVNACARLLWGGRPAEPHVYCAFHDAYVPVRPRTGGAAPEDAAGWDAGDRGGSGGGSGD